MQTIDICQKNIKHTAKSCLQWKKRFKKYFEKQLVNFSVNLTQH